MCSALSRFAAKTSEDDLHFLQNPEIYMYAIVQECIAAGGSGMASEVSALHKYSFTAI
jgi:hypothetical protein